MTKVDKIGPEDWVAVDKIGRTEILGPAKNGCKLDGGKPSLIWTQWTWKPSPRSIGFDADENGHSRQAKQ